MLEKKFLMFSSNLLNPARILYNQGLWGEQNNAFNKKLTELKGFGRAVFGLLTAFEAVWI